VLYFMCIIKVFIKVTGEIFKSSPFTGGIHFFSIWQFVQCVIFSFSVKQHLSLSVFF